MKAIVLSSGGVDSTTCLALAVSEYGSKNVIALSVYYGQKHDKEIEASKKIAEYYGVKRIEMDLSKIFDKSDCSLLKHSTQDIPEKSYKEQVSEAGGKPVSTYVPFRNGLFLSCAVVVAISNKCDFVYYGAHADDAAGSAYPDCSEEFQCAISEAVWIGSGHQVKIVAPFISKNKTEVIKKGIELGVPYEFTWSCYEGGEKPCGKCGTCIDRIRAFEKNKISDPLKYQD